jgi:hypothetical protein
MLVGLPVSLLGVVGLTVSHSFTGMTNVSACARGQWLAQYFNNKTLSGAPVRSQCEAVIDHAWGWHAPPSGVAGDGFSVRWTLHGDFAAGSYRFTTVSDDGLRLTIDPGTPAATTPINHWTDHATATDTAEVTLTSGSHLLSVDYYENTGAATAKLTMVPTAIALPDPSPGLPLAKPSAGSSPSPAPSASRRRTGTAPTTGVPAPVAGWWRSDFSGIPLGTAQAGSATSTALNKQWTFFGQPGQEYLYGRPQVVSPSAEGIPAAPTGDRIMKLAHQPGDTATMHKLYKTFTGRSWPSGAEPYARSGGSPANVSGRYITFIYIPSTLRLSTVDPKGWVNVAQFKEGYTDSSGTSTSNPMWWFGLENFANRGPKLQMANFRNGNRNRPEIDATPYLDTWLKIEFRLYQGNRLELYLDDRLVDTGHQSEFDVGRHYHAGQSADGGATVTREEGWVFGVGNYSNPACVGDRSTVYVGLSTVLPLP